MSKLSFQLPTMHQVCFLTSAVINFVIEDVYDDEDRNEFIYLRRKSCLTRAKDGYGYNQPFFKLLSDALENHVNSFRCERFEAYVKDGGLHMFRDILDRVICGEAIYDSDVYKCAAKLNSYYYDDMFEDPCLHVLTNSGSLTILDLSNVSRTNGKAIEDLVYNTKTYFINSANSLLSLVDVDTASNFLAKVFVSMCSVYYRFAQAYLIAANSTPDNLDVTSLFKQFTDCMDEIDCKFKMACFNLRQKHSSQV